MSFILFQQLSTSKYSILASCLPQIQLALTTSLQLVVYVCKQVTKQPLLTSPRPTKIVNIVLKDSNAYCGTRGYFEGRLALLTLIASQTYKIIPTSLRGEDDTNEQNVIKLTVLFPLAMVHHTYSNNEKH